MGGDEFDELRLIGLDSEAGGVMDGFLLHSALPCQEMSFRLIFLVEMIMGYRLYRLFKYTQKIQILLHQFH